MLTKSNSFTRIPIVSISLKNPHMQRIEEIYRGRLALLVHVHGKGRQSILSKLIDKSPAQISQWLNASKDSKTGQPRSMDRTTAREIETKLGLPVGWMDQPVTNEELNEVPTGGAPLLPTPRLEEEIEILQYDTGGKMGPGIVLHDQPGVIKRWGVTPDWIQNNVNRITSPKNLAIVTGFGDSMRPLFNPGDPLLIDCGVLRVEADGIYFFRVGEEGFVKRLQRIPTINGMVIRARSENLNYEPFDIVSGMDFEVFGRIVKVWRGDEF